ncbi:universal stress protein [Natranaeroarchaeum sulfidigenes]|uniref:universal stress protein n=1 Tax=Natranaeroarchaeum sulfidigenes TaxID=2784880 RepID=UPI001EE5451C|nr:universal stress protein [Natranaeroarchaeum sulfidigenes]
MYNTILYPVDGSEGASAAVSHVRTLAETYSATVHVLHVANSSYLGYESEDGPRGTIGRKDARSDSGMAGTKTESAGKKQARTAMAGTDPSELREAHRERCEKLVADTVAQFEGLDVESIVRVGKPHQVIVGYANNNDIDLVVMGTHGRTGVDRYLLGSVTEKVLRTSDAPVVTVRRDSADD